MEKTSAFEKGFERLKVMNPDYTRKDWYFETVLDERSLPEIGFYSKFDYTIYTSKNFNPALIVGSCHTSYINQMWIEMLGNLERLEIKKIQRLKENNLFEELINIKDDKIHLHKYGNKYFIALGHHRFCIAKFLELSINSVTVLDHRLDEDYTLNWHWFNERGIEPVVDWEDYWTIKMKGCEVIIKKSMIKSFIYKYENVKVNQGWFNFKKIRHKRMYVIYTDGDLRNKSILQLISAHKKSVQIEPIISSVNIG